MRIAIGDLGARLAKLERGHNAAYWVKKIQRNVERDQQHNLALAAAGWTVLRFWEKDILKAPAAVAQTVADMARSRDANRRSPTEAASSTSG